MQTHRGQHPRIPWLRPGPGDRDEAAADDVGTNESEPEFNEVGCRARKATEKLRESYGAVASAVEVGGRETLTKRLQIAHTGMSILLTTQQVAKPLPEPALERE